MVLFVGWPLQLEPSEVTCLLINESTPQGIPSLKGFCQTPE